MPQRAEVEPLVQLVAPFAPHVAEELWERMGHDTSVFDSGWPAFDAAAAAEDEIEVGVQVNGKLRGSVRISRDATEEQVLAAALAVPTIAKFVAGEVRKVVYVKGRVVSVVAGGS